MKVGVCHVSAHVLGKVESVLEPQIVGVGRELLGGVVAVDGLLQPQRALLDVWHEGVPTET